MIRPRPRSPDDAETASEARARPIDRGFVMTLTGAAAVVLFLYMVRQVLLPFAAAGIIALVCEPVTHGLSRLLRAPRAVAAILVFLALAAAAAAFAILAAAPLIGSLTNTFIQLPTLIETLAARLMHGRTLDLMGQSLDAHQLAAQILDALRQLLQPAKALPLVALGFAGFFAVLLGWVLLFYFLLGGPQIARGVLGLVPPPHRPLVRRIWVRLEPVLRRYFIGVAAIVIYASIAAYLGLGLALGLHHAVALAITTGVLEMIPVAGPLTSAVIAGLAAVEQATGTGGIIGYAIYAVALRISIDELIGPLVLGRAGRLHPTAVIFCFLAGALLFGVVGVILAAPMALTINIVLSAIYAELQPPAAVGEQV